MGGGCFFDVPLLRSRAADLFFSLHTLNASIPICADGLEWTPLGFAGPPNPQPIAAFGYTVELTNGSTVELDRRERHQLLFDDKGEPVALFNGVIRSGDGDKSFTLAQPFV